MEYVHTYLHDINCYHRSGIYLHLDSAAVYLVQPNACIRGSGNFYLSDTTTSKSTKPTPRPNGTILTKCNTLNNLMSLTTEAKIGVIFNNARAAVHIRVNLQEMGHPQGPIPIKIDNNAQYGFLTLTIYHKYSKDFDMIFH